MSNVFFLLRNYVCACVFFLVFLLPLNQTCMWVCFHLLFLLQISNQLHFFTKIGDFLHARCKKSLLDVKNLPVAFIVGIYTIPLDPDSERGRGIAPHYFIVLSTHFFTTSGSTRTTVCQ